MKVTNKNLTTLGDKFSGRIHEAFRSSSINKFYSNIEIDRMITYNEVLGEFIDLGYKDLYDEFETRLIEGESPNIILESILIREENKPTLGYLLAIIQYYIDSDITKMFM
tara:strand:- start:30292 stop:30621 length:330 start_codon:yes stop_codon:yes gene_type:complete